MRGDVAPRDCSGEWDPYVANRVAFLAKALRDHTAWKRALDGAGEDAALAVAWVDGDGRRDVVAVDGAYLWTHLKVVRSLMADLAACGAIGTITLRGLFARQLARDAEGQAR
jgi:hypothetical protein